MPQLHARDALLHRLVPRLTGLEHGRQRAVTQEHQDDLPAVLLTGGHGTGKTAVLDDLAAAYSGRLPLGRFDFSQETGGARRPAEQPNSSPAVEMLSALVAELAPGAPGFGRIGFSRLLPGLFAVSSWHRSTRREQEIARLRIEELLPACGSRGRGGEQDGAGWTGDVSAQVGGNPGGGQDLRPVAEAVVRQYLDRHTGRREERNVTDWYHERSEAADDGVDALIRLSVRFHRGGQFRQAVERLLTEAFLADLRDAYGPWKRFNRSPRPLVLLDGAHTAGGAHALGLLLDRRADTAQARPDPLVVVAAGLEGAPGKYPDATRGDLPGLALASGWARTVPGSPSAGLLTVRLSPLGIDDQLAMLDETSHPLHPYLPTALHHLTRGHPLGSSTFCEAVVDAAAEDTLAPERLLELETAGGRRVCELLLERLIPAPQIRSRLIRLSAAWDVEAAEFLAAQGTPSAADPFPAATVRAYLEDEGWPAGSGQPFVGDPFLRALLVQELRATAGHGTGAGDDWAALHRGLRDHHAALGEAGEPAVLRHTLAAGDDRAVTLRLTERFEQEDAARWLGTLLIAADAPHPPSAVWTDRRRETARGGHDGELTDAGQLRRCVNRLLHALWYLAEPTTEPTDEMCDDLGAELAFLSMRHPDGHAVFNRASREWPEAAREKRTPPVAGP